LSAGFWPNDAHGSHVTGQRIGSVEELGSRDPLKFDVANSLGYTLLSDRQTAEAIAVFQRNVEEYPQSSNVYDSLGEAYMKSGEKKPAIENYEKSLRLDPKNANAVEMLKKLRQ
jgi:predicted Zn-dependent protease